jgi:hypothetical protein
MNNKETKAVEAVAAELGCTITGVEKNKHIKFFITHISSGTKLLVVCASTPSSASISIWFKKNLKQAINKAGC